jgi:hypothetical protein
VELLQPASRQKISNVGNLQFIVVKRDNGSVNRAATVDLAIDLGVASPLRVQHHVIRRHVFCEKDCSKACTYHWKY